MMRSIDSRLVEIEAPGRSRCARNRPAAASRRGAAPPASSARPAQTRHSLLAKATDGAAPTAAMVGSSPAAPTIAAMTHSAGRSAASTRAAGPQPTSIPVPASAVLERGILGRIGVTATNCGRSSRACSDQQIDVVARRQRLDLDSRRGCAQEIDRVAADRSRRAQYGDTPLHAGLFPARSFDRHHHARASLLMARSSSARAGPVVNSPATRSRTPPWPGMSCRSNP